MEVVWPLFVAGLIGLLGLYKLVSAAATTRPGHGHRPALTRGILAVVLWLAITGANMMYILSLIWGYDPGLPPDWAMAMLGCGVALGLGYGLLRWTRPAQARGSPN